MGKKLLSKLDKYFTKGVKVGALATAVLMNGGCDALTQLCDSQTEVQQQEQPWNGEDLETYIFARHRFAAEDAKITKNDSAETRIAWSNKHYQHAVEYMRAKVADFRDKVYNQEPAGNFLQNVCDDVFTRQITDSGIRTATDGYDFGNTVDPMLESTNLRYGHLNCAISAKAAIIAGDTSVLANQTCQIFSNCLAMLAVRSYNDSLGYLRNSSDLPVNQDYLKFAERLVKLDMIPNKFDYYAYYDEMEQAINDMLITVSTGTGVSLATLQDAVELSLLNASMRGARDLGAQANFQLSSNNQTLQIPKLAPYTCDNIESISMSQAKYIKKYLDEQEQQNKGL